VTATVTAAPPLDRSGVQRARQTEFSLRRRIFAPPPDLTVSEWADRFRVLSPGASAEPGQWRTDRAPYLRGILDAIGDKNIERVVVMSSTQVGKTEVILNTIGYYIDKDPAPIMVVQPSVKPMAETFSKDRLKPMLRDSPRLRGKVRDEAGRRNSEDTILHKVFPGGHITITGANSAAGLASRPIRVLLFDEVDRYPASAGTEGDPVSLGVKRTETFWNRKIVLVSSPTIKGFSRIEAAYGEGDQRTYEVACPSCGHWQPLRWAQIRFDDASHECRACEARWREEDKPRLLASDRWVAAKPTTNIASFHLNALYSPWATWAGLIDEFRRAHKSPERLKVFTNTVLAETWEAEGEEAADPGALGRRRTAYAAEVPAECGILTAGIDVQRDRLEFLLVGWGEGQRAFLLQHYRLLGDPEQSEVWDRADAMLTREWKHATGGTLSVRCACVDSGAFTASVYRFVRTRQRRGVFATKGVSQRGKPLIGRPQRANKYGVRIVPLGVDTAKDVIFSRLRQTDPASPGHIAIGTADRMDDEFLAQFGAEVVRTRHVRGVPVREYHQIRDRNEAIDLAVLNLAALHLLGPAVYDALGLWVARAQASAGLPEPAAPAPTLPAPRQPAPALRRPSRAGWVNRW